MRTLADHVSYNCCWLACSEPSVIAGLTPYGLPPPGTHYLRGLNNCHQPWCNSDGRRKYNLKPPNPTEEGLASIHSVLFRRDPTLWRAALLYYTVYQASRMSFAELFHDLGRFVKDPSTRWDYCVRAKRGQSNTALPGPRHCDRHSPLETP